MLAYKKNNLSPKILCCFCGDKINLKDSESHIVNCKINFEYELKENYRMPSLYEDLFLRIRDEKTKIQSGNEIIDNKFCIEFNSNAENIYKDFDRKKIIYENEPFYQEKLNKIPKEKPISSEVIFNIENLVMDSLDIFLINSKLKSKTSEYSPLKEICCFICGLYVNFWGIEPHIRMCSKNFIFDKDSKIILQKPNFNIICEIFKEYEKFEAEEYYIEFLIKEFNKESERIFNKVYSTGKKLVVQNRERISSSNLLTPTNKRIVVKRLDKCSSTNLNLATLVPTSVTTLRCFICGNFFTTEDFQLHYLRCKVEAPQNYLSEKNHLMEISEFMNKLGIGALKEDDVIKYNLFSEKFYWETVCKSCSICQKKLNPFKYEKHYKSCQDKMNEEINPSKTNLIKIQRIRYQLDEDVLKEPVEKRKMRKKSMDDIRNYDIKQVRNNIKYYFI